ncbi:hypothetical protein [Serratia fonticola]|uniref:hypothetical protein n=1 Tax=Serratia fonticola TaxID=47917 RepID=UPI001C52EE55|nr:hypothetical protein [Serratia fonticola]
MVEPGAIIGVRVSIGSFCIIAAGVEIGDDNLFLNNVPIGHDCIVGNTTVIGDNSGLAGHVELDDFVQIGNMCAIHQFCLLGAHAHIAHQSGVVQDVPPFVSASGNHAAPIGVNDSAAAFQSLSEQQQQVIQTLYNMLYHNALAINEVKQEVQRLSETYPLLQWFTSFFSRSARGIIRSALPLNIQMGAACGAPT